MRSRSGAFRFALHVAVFATVGKHTRGPTSGIGAVFMWVPAGTQWQARVLGWMRGHLGEARVARSRDDFEGCECAGGSPQPSQRRSIRGPTAALEPPLPVTTASPPEGGARAGSAQGVAAGLVPEGGRGRRLG